MKRTARSEKGAKGVLVPDRRGQDEFLDAVGCEQSGYCVHEQGDYGGVVCLQISILF